MAVSEGLSENDQRVLLSMALAFARVCGGDVGPSNPGGDGGSSLARST